MAFIIGISNILLKGIPKAQDGSSKKISDEFQDTNDKGKTYLRDTTKPVGDACREDGTLKDADEMVWPNSPTELEPPQNNFPEPYDSMYESASEGGNLPMDKVILMLTF